jgi:muramoyltetrapeptide carboxypeptidase
VPTASPTRSTLPPAGPIRSPLIGYSDITILHLALWRHCCLPGFHGPYVGWDQKYYGIEAAENLRRAVMEPAPLIVHQDPRETTTEIMIEGATDGILMGGNLGTIGRAVGWACPSFAGTKLLIEAVDMFIGQIDGTLTQLRRSGCLDGLRGRRGWPVHPLGRNPNPASGR